MVFIDKITFIIGTVGGIILAITGIGLVIYFYLTNVKRKKRFREDSINYSLLQREDTVDFIKNIHDIKDNMIITDNGTRFVAVIRCQGSDLYDCQIEEQASIVQGFMSFINTITKPISYRQYCQEVDLEDTKINYEMALSRLEEQLFNAVEDKKDLNLKLKKESNVLLSEDIEIYQARINSLQKQINAFEFRRFHLQDQIRYIDAISGNKVSPKNQETWVFDWYYDENDFDGLLNESEIHERAIKELNTMTRAKIHALSRSKVRAYRCSTQELIEMCRHQSCPISAARYKIKDILKSSFFDDIVTSSSPQDILQQGLDESAEQRRVQYMFEILQYNPNEEAKVKLDSIDKKNQEKLNLYENKEISNIKTSSNENTKTMEDELILGD